MVQFASYLRRALCKTRLIFPRINGPNIFGSGTVSFGRIRPIGQRELALEVDHFDQKVFKRSEAFHLFLDRNFPKFWHYGKHPSSNNTKNV